MTDELMSEIKVPRTDGSIITVVGVGGAGGNAVNHMWNLGIRGRYVHGLQHRPAGARQKPR